MPIQTSSPIQVLDQESFHRVERRVTGIAFEIHNEFGRYLDERLYQRELTRRLREAGFDVEPELRMAVSLEDFRKDYYADLLVSQGVIIETKAVEALSPAHKGQTLNYLFLCGLYHGALLNFRTERVQREFVSTRLTPEHRRQFSIIDQEWKPLSPECNRLGQLLSWLLREWGAFLDPLLYRDALTHFLGGENQIVREIDVQSGSTIIGTQTMRLLTDEIAFSLTTATHRPRAVFEHQQRFLRHTPLRAIQWINLNHHQIEFRTIER